MEDFQIYEKYCQNKPRSESLWRQFSDSVFFQVCLLKSLNSCGFVFFIDLGEGVIFGLGFCLFFPFNYLKNK